MHIDQQGYERKKCKLRSKGPRSVRWPTFEILGSPPHLGNGWS